MNREFFTARTVGEALAGFRPARRTAVETVALAEALHRVPATDVRAPTAMPGFARSTVDGYAVRAADTYGASEGLPSYLDLAGAVRMGTAPTVAVSHGKVRGHPDRRGAAGRGGRRGDGRVHRGDHARHDRGDPAGGARRRAGPGRRGRRRG